MNQIVNIRIEKLFNQFSYNFDINSENRIKIISAPNGYGKTVFFKLIYSLFNRDFDYFFKIPFNLFSIKFSNNYFIKITKDNSTGEYDREQQIQIEYCLNSNFNTKSYFYREENDYYKFFLKRKDQRDCTIYDEQLLFEHFIPNEINCKDYLISKNKKKKPEKNKNSELFNYLENQKIFFIDTQRLLKRSKKDNYISSVKNNAEEIKQFLTDSMAAYGRYSQSLDESFVKRVLETEIINKLPTEQLRDKLKQLEKRRQELSKSGLFTNNPIDESLFEKINSENASVLSLYAQDVEKKLENLNNIHKKISLFLSIINNHYSHKQLTINPETGFIFKTNDGSNLEPDYLSSGEQHILVLNFELLFNVEPNSIILIDEPELSLHVLWQLQFINDIKEIVNLMNFDIWVATHSPEIISDHWEYLIDLSKPD